jgi:hypothetical protein
MGAGKIMTASRRRPLSNLLALDPTGEVGLPETAIFLKWRPILSTISRNRKKGE